MAREASEFGLPSQPAYALAHRPSWRTRLLFALGLVFVGSFLAILILTDSSPDTAARKAPTAEQVGAGREAVYQLRASGGESRIGLGPVELDGLSAVATDGLRPDRLHLYVHEGAFYAAGSHELPFGRWLNVTLKASEHSAGFPKTHLKIGDLSLTPYFSRQLFEAGRWLLHVRGVDVPPLDQIVQKFSVGTNGVAATVRLPDKAEVVEHLAGLGHDIEAPLVLERYCQLASAQASDPQSDFALQLRRAFPADRAAGATPATNRAAFIALAMLVVDARVGYLAKIDDAEAGKCAAPSSPIMLHGRTDLPKHWALSAALTAGTGMKLAESLGIWKELADSLSKQSHFEKGDPTGFSFIDLSADRSGSRIASAAILDAEARFVAGRLSMANSEQILPRALMGRAEGLKGDDFEIRYGGIDDPRYTRAVGEIDMIIEKEGLLGH